ncbi:23S rRNA (guanosine(2251)-2'-O)-methyltransferase RlmB [Jatrophihabitans sp. YIM 134969]
MAGNSQRRGAVRGSKKGSTTGTGGKNRASLSGRGPTPKAEDRPYHPAARRARAADKAAGKTTGRGGNQGRGSGRNSAANAELLVGRNPVLEALRANVPATALYVIKGGEPDERITESLKIAGDRLLPLLEVGKGQLDRLTDGLLHQGIALQVPPYRYTELPDLLARAQDTPGAPLLVALDGVTDPRNLGAVIRSAAAFGGDGVIITERRAAGVTAAAWRTSAGAAARLPVSQVTNLSRSIDTIKKAGIFVVGLAAGGDTDLDALELATDPLCVVVGSEGDGLSRLVAEKCDLLLSIPMAGPTESLNASVAAAVTLAEVARLRRLQAQDANG